MNANIDYQSRRRLQNRIAQQRFRERNRKYSGPLAHDGVTHAPQLLPDNTPESQEDPGDDIITTEHWAAIQLPKPSSSALEYHVFADMESKVEPIPRGQWHTLPPLGLEGCFERSEHYVNTPRTSAMGFDVEFDESLWSDIPGTTAHTASEDTGAHEQRLPQQPQSAEDVSRELCSEGITGVGYPSSRDEAVDGNFQILDAVFVLQKQKDHLGKQAEDLIQRLISIYDLGVSLEIFPCDPHLKQVLKTANAKISSIWK